MIIVVSDQFCKCVDLILYPQACDILYSQAITRKCCNTDTDWQLHMSPLHSLVWHCIIIWLLRYWQTLSVSSRIWGIGKLSVLSGVWGIGRVRTQWNDCFYCSVSFPTLGKEFYIWEFSLFKKYWFYLFTISVFTSAFLVLSQ